MADFRLKMVFLLGMVFLSGFVDALKCRTYQEVQENSDFEYVVRMCLRRMNNETNFIDQLFKNRDQSGGQEKGETYNTFYSSSSNDNNNKNNQNGYQNGDNRYYGNDYNNGGKGYNENYNNNQQDNGNSNSFDNFWSFGNGQRKDRNNGGQWNEDEGKRGEDYSEESDYYSSQRGDGRNSHKSRPHSHQQQIQHEREKAINFGSKNSPNYFFSPNRKPNTNFSHLNKNRNSDSPLADIEPCVIHCIFQEMKMVDGNGKPNKELISLRMTQKIRNSELKNFIRESVDECYERLEESDFGNDSSSGNGRNQRGRRNQNEMCEWAKTFAICLEDKGKEKCEDWNEPTQNANKNKGSGSGNNKNETNSNKRKNSNQNKGNDNQKNKSKQSEMG